MNESVKDFALLVSDCLDPLEGFSMKPMMGVYVMHYQGKVLGFVMDGYLLLEDGPQAKRLLPDNEREPLFPGSKDFVVVRDVGNPPLLREICVAIYPDLPLSKPRKSDKNTKGQAAAKPKGKSKKSSWKDKFEEGK